MATLDSFDTLITYARETGPARELARLIEDQSLVNSIAQNIFNATANHLQQKYAKSPDTVTSIQNPIILTYFLSRDNSSTHRCYQVFFNRMNAIFSYSDRLDLKDKLCTIQGEFLKKVADQLRILFRQTMNERTQTKFYIEFQPYDVRFLDGYILNVFPNIAHQSRANSLRIFIYQNGERSIQDYLKPEPFSITERAPLTWDEFTPDYVRKNGRILYARDIDNATKTLISYNGKKEWAEASLQPVQAHEEPFQHPTMLNQPD